MSSGRITVGEPARDFTLEDTRGRFTRLSDYQGQQIVYLVFNRGFA
ncbi:MAG: redoxin domain-containing protein [Anaerolineaceae bacterium]|nr:redoxin domain-containing protein [Anaerolineaceae bacterium]